MEGPHNGPPRLESFFNGLLLSVIDRARRDRPGEEEHQEGSLGQSHAQGTAHLRQDTPEDAACTGHSNGGGRNSDVIREGC